MTLNDFNKAVIDHMIFLGDIFIAEQDKAIRALNEYDMIEDNSNNAEIKSVLTKKIEIYQSRASLYKSMIEDAKVLVNK